MQFPAASLYASSPVSKRTATEESFPSSDDLGSVILTLEEELVVDNEMDVALAPPLDHRPREEEDDIFSD